MTRPLRIAYKDAWYHVMNRGRRGEAIFAGKDDYIQFVNLLKETVALWNLRIVAYCLMENHYHLLVQTPDANISRCMRHINGVKGSSLLLTLNAKVASFFWSRTIPTTLN